MIFHCLAAFVAVVFGGCLEVNRVGQTNLTVTAPASAYSIELWWKINDASQSPTSTPLLSTSNDRELSLGFTSSGALYLLTQGTQFASSQPALLFNQWTYVIELDQSFLKC